MKRGFLMEKGKKATEDHSDNVFLEKGLGCWRGDGLGGYFGGNFYGRSYLHMHNRYKNFAPSAIQVN